MSDLVRVAAVQMNVLFGQAAENCRQMERHLRSAAKQGAQLVAFPECALAGYCFDSLDEARPHAETIPGPSTARLAEVCRELSVRAIVGLLEADGPRVFNACVLLGPGGVEGSYRSEERRVGEA